MDSLISAATVQVVGTVIVAAALLQVAVLLFGSLRRVQYGQSRQGLALDLLRERVETQTTRRQLEEDRARLTWTGARKFRVMQKVQEGGDICSFYLVPHDGKALPPFQPGQYLTFLLKLPGRDKPLIRCYSLSDSPFNAERYRVSIKRVPPPRDRPELPPGQSSNFFHDRLNEGDILDVKAPGGHFYLDLSKHTPVVLIGGGVGLTPVLSMLNAICEAGSKRETWLFYGVRNNDDCIMREHLERLDRENENVHLQICFSNPTNDDVAGRDFHHSERVSVELFKRVLPSSNYEFYMCGPPPMMEALNADLKEWSVPEAHVNFEAFGPATVRKTKAAPVATEGEAPIQVEFAKSGKTVAWSGSSDSLLEFAEDNDIMIDSGCRAGNCGTCVTAIKTGEVSYVLEPGETPESGSCLTCIAVPKSNLTLDA